jgi:hypothetical protein
MKVYIILHTIYGEKESGVLFVFSKKEHAIAYIQQVCKSDKTLVDNHWYACNKEESFDIIMSEVI